MWIHSSTQVSKSLHSFDFFPPKKFCLHFKLPANEDQGFVNWLFVLVLQQRTDVVLCAGMAALHEAVLTGNLDVVKLLVKYGADVHQRDEDGWTPLHMACSDGYPEIAR